MENVADLTQGASPRSPNAVPGLRDKMGIFIPSRTPTATVLGTFQQQTHSSESLGGVGKHPFLQRCCSFSNLLLLSLLKIPEIIFFRVLTTKKKRMFWNTAFR